MIAKLDKHIKEKFFKKLIRIISNAARRKRMVKKERDKARQMK